MRKPIYGVGINDADYSVYITEYVKETNKRRTVWVCPFYKVWLDMLKRCYGKNQHKTYDNCTVCRDWLIFSNFRNWMKEQDWINRQLDKDLLSGTRKVYSPSTCCFVPKYVNTAIVYEAEKCRELPLGVTKIKRDYPKKYQASESGSRFKWLGYFYTPEEAHRAW